MNSKEINIILFIFIIIILFLLCIKSKTCYEDFTGFRKCGCGREEKNDDSLFPFLPKNFFINYLTSPNLT